MLPATPEFVYYTITEEQVKSFVKMTKILRDNGFKVTLFADSLGNRRLDESSVLSCNKLYPSGKRLILYINWRKTQNLNYSNIITLNNNTIAITLNISRSPFLKYAPMSRAYQISKPIKMFTTKYMPESLGPIIYDIFLNMYKIILSYEKTRKTTVH